MPLIPPVPRRKLARDVLKIGVYATMEQLTALGQAKIAYCEHVLEICKKYPEFVELGKYIRTDVVPVMASTGIKPL